MQTTRNTNYCFKAKWFDEIAQLDRHYNIRYYVEPHQIEIIDKKTNKLFLKKTDCPVAVAANDFFVGANVCIFGRVFELLDYSDASTREMLTLARQRSLLIVKRAFVCQIGTILDTLERQGCALSSLKLMQIDPKEAEEFYNSQLDQVEATRLIASLIDGPIVAIEIIASNCVEKLKQLMPTELLERLRSGDTADLSCFEFPKTVAEVGRYRNFFIDKLHNNIDTAQNCTCVVVLPHIVKKNLTGKVIEAIQASPDLIVTAMESFHLDRASAIDFLEVYDGVLPHYRDAVDHLVSGLCVAIRLEGKNTHNVVSDFRANAGPWDVDMAKKLRPHTIRAKFGIDRVRNAVHCTDLPEDGSSECDFFFNILTNQKKKV